MENTTNRTVEATTDLPQWDVPVSWTMVGTMTINANSFEEACELAYDEELPTNGQYLDDSFRVDE